MAVDAGVHRAAEAMRRVLYERNLIVREALFLNKSVGSLWYSLDSTLNPVVYKLAGIFRGRNTFMTQKTAYIITIVALFVARLVGGILFSIIVSLLMRLPV